MDKAVVICYDYPIAVTLSDTTDDPSGPFTAFLCTMSGFAVVYPYAGPQSTTPLVIPVLAGVEYHFPVRRFGQTNATATVLGYVSAHVRATGGRTS